MIKITHNIDKVIADLKKRAEVSNTATNGAIDNFMKKAQRDVKTEFFTGQHGDRGLNSQSGRAKNSWKIKETFSDSMKKAASLFSNVPYIEVHETRTRRLDLRKWWSLKVKELEDMVRKVYK